MLPIQNTLGLRPGELTGTDTGADSQKDGWVQDGGFTSGTREGEWSEGIEDIA